MAAMKQPHHAVYLGDDVLIDILSRLPTPDVCRCKCVSKQWHSSLVPLVLTQRPNYLGFFGLQNMTNSKPRFLSLSDNGPHSRRRPTSPSVTPLHHLRRMQWGGHCLLTNKAAHHQQPVQIGLSHCQVRRMQPLHSPDVDGPSSSSCQEYVKSQVLRSGVRPRHLLSPLQGC